MEEEKKKRDYYYTVAFTSEGDPQKVDEAFSTALSHFAMRNETSQPLIEGGCEGICEE